MNYTHYGNAGIGFNLVKEFETQAQMITEFSKGEAYTEVRQGEYVIIGSSDTTHGGKIYRRGFNLTNGLGGAVYITDILATTRAMINDLTTVKANPEGEAVGTLKQVLIDGSIYAVADIFGSMQSNGYQGTETEFYTKFNSLLNMTAAEEESF